MPKVSVIVPVYGVEKYIERCVRSLMEQTLDDMEFIFVDDCTKDASIEILQRVIDDYPNRIAQVKIIHHEVNKGLPQARKTGVLASNGDYIAHCDSDDWMEANSYEILYKEAIENKADMVFYDYARTDGNKKLEYRSNYSGRDKNEIIINMIAGKILYGVVFHLDSRQLYLKDDFEWPEYGMSEDLTFTIQLLCRAKSFVKVDKVLYNYYYNDESMTRSHDTLEKVRQTENNISSLIRFLNGTNLQNKDLYIILCKLFMKHRCVDKTGSKEGYELWKSFYPEVTPKVLLNLRVPMIMRIRYILGYTRTYTIVKKLL